jgi:hypothetical protein
VGTSNPAKSDHKAARKAVLRPKPKPASEPQVNAEAPTMRVDMIPLTKLERWPRNPKLHDHTALSESINRWGYTQPILIDERSGKMVAGHGRLENLTAMKQAGGPPPERVQLGPGGEWLIPVLRGVAFKSDDEAEAYLLADNRIVEIGGWNDEELLRMLTSIAGVGNDLLQSTGFNERSLELLKVSEQNRLALLDPNQAVFPEFGEAAADDVKVVKCPHCNGDVPV